MGKEEQSIIFDVKSPTYKAVIFSLVNEKNKAIEVIQSLQNNTFNNYKKSFFYRYKNFHWYDLLRSDERFVKILEVEKSRYDQLRSKYNDIISE